MKRIQTSDIKPLEDEAIINVHASMGGYAGQFVWPIKDLDILRQINTTKYGYVFIISTDRDPINIKIKQQT